MNAGSELKVWDPAVRVFHWSLAASFFVAYLLSEEDWLGVHVWAGYTVLGLVLFRLIWGFIGPMHARFTDFVRRPAIVLAHLKDLARLRTRRYLGHNPAGGAMIVTLLTALLATALTGVALYGAEQHAGPLVGLMAGIGKDGAEAIEEAHEFLANFTLALVAIHVAGVVVESVLHRENLARAMMTGRKQAL